MPVLSFHDKSTLVGSLDAEFLLVAGNAQIPKPTNDGRDLGPAYELGHTIHANAEMPLKCQMNRAHEGVLIGVGHRPKGRETHEPFNHFFATSNDCNAYKRNKKTALATGEN